MFRNGVISMLVVMLVAQHVLTPADAGVFGRPMYWLFGPIAFLELLMLANVTLTGGRAGTERSWTLRGFFLGDLVGLLLALIVVSTVG